METTLDGEILHLSHLEKELWPGVTKAELIDYYLAVAPLILPRLAERPVTLKRYPGGFSGEAFYQKHLPPTEKLPTGLTSGPEGILVSSRAALAFLGNLATLEIHVGLAKVREPDRPLLAVFDLDPVGDAPWPEIKRGALAIRALLSEMGYRLYPKTSGQNGCHLFLPLLPGPSFNEVQTFVRGVGESLRRDSPSFWTLERSRNRRRGQVYLDYLQNGPARSMVAPYSPRAVPGAPLSWPFGWEAFPPEGSAWNLVQARRSLPVTDPWAGFWEGCTDGSSLPNSLLLV